jgi:AbrB family looped-hinge helix DNA binding protein
LGVDFEAEFEAELTIPRFVSWKNIEWTEICARVGFQVVSTPLKSDFVCFTTKGQVVIPMWLRKQFNIEDGTKAVVKGTPDGILLKPMTSVLIRHGRGILKRQTRGEPLAEDWVEHKKVEKGLEDRHAR